MNGVSVRHSGVCKAFGRIECVRTLNFNGQRAVVVWVCGEGGKGCPLMQRYNWENCAEEDCSLGASSRSCGTVSRREVPKDGESGK